MKRLFFLAALLISCGPTISASPVPESGHVYLPMVHTGCRGSERLSGENPAVQWQPLEMTFTGPAADEADTEPNPFTQYKFRVTFIGPAGQYYDVPGFFNGGSSWVVRFSPDAPGRWKYCAEMRSGENIAASLDPFSGERLWQSPGVVEVAPRQADAPGFYKWGRLQYIGGHYLKFADGPYFLKRGTNSPENFLAYSGFDNTHDQDGNFLHHYAPHGGIYGALDYLSSKGINSIYFLPMNLGGDGQDTYPFIDPAGTREANTHYDVSKLNQWNDLFDYAATKGIMLQFVLGETEAANRNWLDSGTLGLERKIFYREMVARFGYLPAVKWNLSEEAPYSPATLSAFAAHLSALDSFDHPIGFHTDLNDTDAYGAVLGDEWMSITSYQFDPDDADYFTELWRQESAASGRAWVVDMDEAWTPVGLTCCNAVELRKTVLWDVYLSGGNIEWYIGLEDQTLENFTIYDDMWHYMAIANDTVSLVPFWTMGPADHLLTGESVVYGGGEVLAGSGNYIVYLPDSQAGGNLSLMPGTYSVTIIDPATGEVISQSVEEIAGLYNIPPGSGDTTTVLRAVIK